MHMCGVSLIWEQPQKESWNLNQYYLYTVNFLDGHIQLAKKDASQFQK